LRSFNSPNPGSNIQHTKHQTSKNLTKFNAFYGKFIDDSAKSDVTN